MPEAAAKALELMKGRTAAYVVTPNPEIVMLSRSDPSLADILNGADLVLPDGIGIIIGSKILGVPLKQRLPGIDFAQTLFSLMAERGMSLFLLGARPGVAAAAAENLARRFEGLNIVGENDGYFTDSGPVIEKINSLSPDLLLVCLGAPQQERWMKHNAPKLNVGLMAGLGGSLDIFAGIAERAPEKWQRLGLEWLYRLKKDPGRASRMLALPKFVFAVIDQKISGKK
jgi:N-acetylglucosaminyldiphosphoundecaprenol N-acetyl-beta-D-mannosaminyltransferase